MVIVTINKVREMWGEHQYGLGQESDLGLCAG